MLPSTTNHDYTLTLPAIQAVRDAVLGGVFVKRKGYLYLPHPSQLDQSSPEAIARYQEYLAGAEFDDVAGQTLASYLGRMQLSNTEFEFDSRLEYLIENSDNDGTSLTGQIEQVAANIMQFGFHILVAEYLNATGPTTVAAARQSNIRAAIKSYTRDSLVDWSFSRIGGIMQLSYLKFYEFRSELDPNTGTRKDVTEYFVMALDEEGSYYWQKFNNDTLTQSEASRNYVTVQGKPLKWLPVEIVAAVEPETGRLPLALGLIAPIAFACLDRYRVSADYKETIKNICPTSYTAGWTEQAWEQFVEMNQGRQYIAFGAKAMNNLPQGVTMDTLNPSISLEGFERYFESNKQKIIALGGVWPDANGSAAKTATQSENESSEVTSRLVSIANNIEAAYRRIVIYCGVLEGLYPQDAIEQQLDAVMVSEFARSKMTPQESKEVRDNYLAGLYSKAEAIRILKRGGLTVSDVEVLFAESEEGA